MRVTQVPAFFVVVAFTLTLGACGGGSASTAPPPPPPPTITSVAVSPDSSTLVVGDVQQFSATVKGTGNFNPNVNWFVNGVQGGNFTTGTINLAGTYVAPATVPAPNTVTVSAKSVRDTSKSASSSVTVEAENVQISVNPASASVQLGATQKFNVTVTGTVKKDITWTINGYPTNFALPWGTIDFSGLYTAPTLLPVAPVVTLTATSNEDPTKSVSATATILANAGGINVSITPTDPNVVFDGSQSVQFTAQVTGTSNTAVSWSVTGDDVNLGQITADGLYTPAGLNCTNNIPHVAVHAVSVANAGAQGATSAVLVPPTLTITGISPQPAAAETDLQIAGTIPLGPVPTVFFPAPHSQTIATGTTVPLGSTSGPLYIQMKCGQFPLQQSNTVHFQRQPRLRIRADRKDLSAGESVQLHGVMLGDDTPQNITWGNGINSSGIYTAPSLVSADTFVTLSGCIQNTTACDSLIVRVNPVSIGPIAPIVPMGGILQLSATSEGVNVSPTWSVLAGGGDLHADGHFVAPTTLADSGPIPIVASFGGFDAKASIAVTGAYPGLVNRVNDYLNLENGSDPAGTITSSMAVDSSHAYVLSVDNFQYVSGPKECWIDAYDISDPRHPVWLDAAEALNSEPSQYFCAGSLYTYGGLLYEVVLNSGSGTGPFSEIVAYSFSNNHLQLKRIWQVTPLASVYFNQGVFYTLPQGSNPGANGDPISAIAFDIRSGDLVQTQLSLPLPQPGVTAAFGSPVGVGKTVYLVAKQPGGSQGTPVLCKYDISTNPAMLLSTVDAFVGLPSETVLLSRPVAIFGDKLYDNWDIFDISGTLPVRVGTLPNTPADMNLATSQALNGPSVVTITDVSNPASPKVVSALNDVAALPEHDPVWVGNLFYQVAEGNGWGIWDASGSGGQIPLSALPDAGVFGYIFGQVSSGSTLYTAEQTDVGPLVNIYDLSGADPVRVGFYSENGQDPFSVALLGTSLFVGTEEGLLTLNVSNPASPSKISSVAVPTSAVAISGHYLFSGTTDNRLVVFDVSNPASPQQVGQKSLPDFPVNVWAAGNLLLIADDAAGLLVYGISNPSNPTLLSRFQSPNSSATVDVTVDGNLALLAAADGGLVILDIANPSSPVLLSQTDMTLVGGPGAAAMSVAVNRGIAFVGAVNTTYGAAFGFDYKVPAHPRLVSTMSYGGALDEAPLNFAFYQSQMFVGGNLFAVADRRSDLTQPRNVINLYYPGLAGGSGSLENPVPRKVATHPKLKRGKKTIDHAR